MEIYNELGTLEDVQISEANDSQSSLSMLTEGFLNSSPMIENRILKNLKIPQLGKTTPIEQALVNTEKFLEDNWKGYSIIPNNINVGSTTPGCIPVEEQLRVEMNTHLMTKMMDPSIFSKYFNLFTLIHFATYLVFIVRKFNKLRSFLSFSLIISSVL